KIGILAQFTGNMLFGLEYEQTKSEISKELTLSCIQNQESNLIELTTKLREIYPPNYIIKGRELRAWRALLQRTGCTNITPFGKESV
ncbi:7814_t:CDS:2, partial [Dentiscutata heterogama]